MTKIIYRFVSVIALVFLLETYGSSTATAQSSLLRGGGRNDVAEAKSVKIIPLSEVLRSLRKTQKGRHLNSELLNRNGKRPYYRVKWLTPHGKRVDFYVDARTGVIRRKSGG